MVPVNKCGDVGNLRGVVMNFKDLKVKYTWYFIPILFLLLAPGKDLLLAAECSWTPSNYCCMASELTVSPAGQYPKYIQKSSGSISGYTGGCGYGCLTTDSGAWECGGDHSWGCTTSQSGLISGAVTYSAQIQMTLESGCTLQRVAGPVSFEILVDAGKPQATVSFPENNAVVRLDDKITGTATDDYQLGSIAAGTQSYSFLGTLPGSDEGGTLYYDSEDLRDAPWELPVSAVGQCVDTLQEVTLNLYDAVGSSTDVKLSIYVDCSTPTVTIADPVALSTGMSWTDPENPFISGTADDDIEVDKIWLTI